jgi:hypothetical protein
MSEIDKSLELSILKPEFDELKRKMEEMKAEAEVVRTKSRSFLLNSKNNDNSDNSNHLIHEEHHLIHEEYHLHQSSIEHESIIIHLTQFLLGFFTVLGDEEYLIRNYHISHDHEKGR